MRTIAIVTSCPRIGEEKKGKHLKPNHLQAVICVHVSSSRHFSKTKDGFLNFLPTKKKLPPSFQQITPLAASSQHGVAKQKSHVVLISRGFLSLGIQSGCCTSSARRKKRRGVGPELAFGGGEGYGEATRRIIPVEPRKKPLVQLGSL